MIKYIESSKIQMYPSAYRDDNDAEASLNTEYNLTHTKQLSEVKELNSYVIESGTDYVVYMQGYYFRFAKTEINTDTFSGDNIYGYIKTEIGVNTQGDNELKLSRLSNIKDNTTVLLDVYDSDAGKTYFGGLQLSDDTTIVDSKLLFTKVEGSYEIAEEAKYKLTTDEIRNSNGNNQYSPISKKLTTIDVETTNLNGRDVGEIFVEGSTEVNQAVLADTVTTTPDTSNELIILGVQDDEGLTTTIKRDTNIKVEGNTLKSVNLDENSTLNGRNIEDVFVLGSNDVKNAANVTTSIANNNLTDIFEEDSDDDITTIVKEATKATNDGNDNNIVNTYATKTELGVVDTKIDEVIDGTTTVSHSSDTGKLATAVDINGTSFDGSTSITTDIWGTARNITISDNDETNTQKTENIDGSDNFTLKLPSTIKATLTGNSDTTTKLVSPKNLKVDLSSTTARPFDGSSDVTNIGVSNILNVANGGTGNNTGTVSKCTTTVDTSNTLYLLGVQSGAESTIKRDTSIKIKGNTITGNLSGTATKATQDGNGNTISSTYLKLSGGTMTGDLNFGDDKVSIYRFDTSDSRRMYLSVESNKLNSGLIISTKKIDSIDTSILPVLTNVCSLGSSNYKFKDLYVKNLNLGSYKSESAELSVSSNVMKYDVTLPYTYSSSDKYTIYVRMYNSRKAEWYSLPQIYCNFSDSIQKWSSTVMSYPYEYTSTSWRPILYTVCFFVENSKLKYTVRLSIWNGVTYTDYSGSVTMQYRIVRDL